MKLYLNGRGYLDVEPVLKGGTAFLELQDRTRSVLILMNGQLTKHNANDYRIANKEYADQIADFCLNGLTFYRGIPRWHATWHFVRGGQDISALGHGDYPDFSTNNCRYVPFTAVKNVAVGAAISKKGMGDKDNIAFVKNYAKHATFPVGMVVRYDAPKETPVGFCNASECQIRGPIPGLMVWIEETYRMGTLLKDIFGIKAGMTLKEAVDAFIKTGEYQHTLSAMMPDLPTKDEVAEFTNTHGALLN